MEPTDEPMRALAAWFLTKTVRLFFGLRFWPRRRRRVPVPIPRPSKEARQPARLRLENLEDRLTTGSILDVAANPLALLGLVGSTLSTTPTQPSDSDIPGLLTRTTADTTPEPAPTSATLTASTASVQATEENTQPFVPRTTPTTQPDPEFFANLDPLANDDLFATLSNRHNGELGNGSNGLGGGSGGGTSNEGGESGNNSTAQPDRSSSSTTPTPTGTSPDDGANLQNLSLLDPGTNTQSLPGQTFSTQPLPGQANSTQTTSPSTLSLPQQSGNGLTSNNGQLSPDTQAQLLQQYGNAPLFFEQNQGQVSDSNVQFLSRGPGATATFSSAGVSLSFQGNTATGQSSPNDNVQLNFVGASSNVRITGHDQLDTKVNYYVGDQANWHENITTYGSIAYENLYDGVDLVWHPSQFSTHQWQYDYVVRPGADSSALKMNFSGATSVHLDADGTLHAQLANGELIGKTPILYQVGDSGQRELVQGGFQVNADGTVGFQVTGAYDKTRPLILDPTLAYSRYWGGPGDNWATAIAVNSAGEATIVGRGIQPNAPAGTPATAFAVRFDATGRFPLRVTYFGGTGNDQAEGLALTSTGETVVVGMTNSTNFVTTQGAFQRQSQGGTDGFVVRLGTDLQLMAGTYLGGSGNDQASSVVVNQQNGQIIVTGSSQFTTFPGTQPLGTPSGMGDLFVAALNPIDCSRVWSRYLNVGTAEQQPHALAVDPAGYIFVGGGMGVVRVTPTGSSVSDPVSLAAQGIVSVEGLAVGNIGTLGPAGIPETVYVSGGSTVAYLTPYLNGISTLALLPGTQARDLAVDLQGRIYVAGQIATGGPNGIDAFVQTFNGVNIGGQWAYTAGWSQTLGGTGTDVAYGLAVDQAGNTYLTGQTTSSDFPTWGSASSLVGNSDAFVAKFQVNPNQTSSTTLTASPNPSALGQAVTFTAAVVAPGGTPSGTVSFSADGNPLGTAPLNSLGLATWTATNLTVGAHSVVATYNGNTYYTSSTSAPLTQTVTQGISTTTLTSSPDPSVFGQAVTLTATVSGPAAPTGVVDFYDGTYLLATHYLTGSENGVTTFTTTALGVGTHVLTAVYLGDSNLQGSSSGSVSQVVTALPAPTVTGLSVGGNSPTGSTAGGALVTVSGSGFTGATAVSFGGVAATSFTISSDSTILAVAPAHATGVVDVTVTNATGTSPTNSADKFTYTPTATTTTLTTSPSSSTYGQNVTLTATVTGGQGSLVPTGNVTFWDGTNPTPLYTGALPSSGVVSFSTALLTAGTHQLTAVYSGDGNFTSSTSAPVTQTVTLPVVTLTGASPQNLVEGTSTGSFVISRDSAVTALDVSLSISGGVPGVDFNLVVNGAQQNSATQHFAPGVLALNVSVQPIDENDEANPPENVSFQLQPGSGYTLGNNTGLGMTIAEPLATITISRVDSTALVENGTTGSFVVTRAGNTATALDVPLSITGIPSTDYAILVDGVLVQNGMVHFIAGGTQRTVTVVALNDGNDGPGEAFTCQLQAGSGYSLVGLSSVNMSVAEPTPTVPVVSLYSYSMSGSEWPTSTVSFTVARNGADTTHDLNVWVTLGGTAVSGTDYTGMPPGQMVTILAGQTSATVTLTPVNIQEIDGDKTIEVSLANNSNYTLGPSNTVTLTIQDPTFVSVQTTDANASESDLSTAAFVFTRDGGDLSSRLVVYYDVGGTAVAGTDYIGPDFVAGQTAWVVFDPYQTEATVVIVPMGDNISTAETINLVLNPGADYNVTGTLTTSCSLTEDPVATPELPLVSLKADTFTADENGLVPATFTVERSTGPTDQDLKVFFQVSGSATLGGNYTGISIDQETGLGYATIAAGDSTATITITPMATPAAEGDQTITLALVAEPDYTLDNQTGDTITLRDAQPTVRVTALNAVPSKEGLTPGYFNITRTGDLSQPVRVYYQLGGAAVAGTDYAPVLGWVDIPAQTATVSGDNVDVTIQPLAATQAEGSKTVTLTLLPALPGTVYHLDDSTSASLVVQALPGLALSVPPVVSTTTPQVTVSALNGASFPDGTQVYIDVDPSGTGQYSDGNLGLTQATVTGGTATFSLTALADPWSGTIRARAVDAAGDEVYSDSMPLSVDTTATAGITLSLATDSSGGANVTNHAVLQGQITDPDHTLAGRVVTFSGAGGGISGTATADAQGNFTFDPGLTVDGDYSGVVASFQSASGSTVSSDPLEFTLDTTPPVPSVSLLGANVMETGNPTLSLLVTDNVALPPQTTVSVDVDFNNDGTFNDVLPDGTPESGYATTTLTATGTTASGTLQLDPALPEGVYQLRVRVTDLAGNEGTSAPVTFYVDASPPTVTLSAPPAFTNNATPQVSAQVTSIAPLPAGTQVAFDVNGTSVTGNPFSTTVTGTIDANNTATVTLPSLLDGNYTVQAHAVDALGHEGLSGTNSFTVDTVAPSVTLKTRPVTNSLTPTVTVNASDLNLLASGQTVKILLGGGVWTTAPLDNGQATFQLPALPGAWSGLIRAEVVDQAGNVGYSSPQMLTVDPSLAQDITLELANDSSNGQNITNNATLKGHLRDWLSSTSGVTVTFSGGLSGTTTTDSQGNFSFTPTGLADGVYSNVVATFTGTDGTVVYSSPLTFTLDTTPPSVVFLAPSTTTQLSPLVLVAATDSVGLSSPATVTLYGDTNGNGQLASNASVYTISTLASTGMAGVAVFAITPNLSLEDYDFQARVTDQAGNVGVSTVRVVHIASPTELNIAAQEASATQNVPGTFTLATFSNTTYPTTSASDYTATVDWGDGTQSDGRVVAQTAPNSFSVLGSHTYSDWGYHTITVKITTAGEQFQADAYAIISPNLGQPQVFANSNVTGVEGQPITVNSWFADNDGVGPYQQTTDWGDNTTTTVQVDQNIPVGWSLSDGGVAEIRTRAFNSAEQSPVVPPGGNPFMVWLSTSGTTDTSSYHNSLDEPGTQGTVLQSQTVTLAADDTISFRWYFAATDLGAQDFATVYLNDDPVMTVDRNSASSGQLNAWNTFTQNVDKAGDYQLTVILSNASDTVGDSDFYLAGLRGITANLWRSTAHAYAEPGSYTPITRITDITGNTGSSTLLPANISEAQLVGSGAIVSAVEGQPQDDVVLATFTDPGAANESAPDPADSYPADANVIGTYVSGTGKITNVRSVPIGNGLFQVLGSIDFAQKGVYPINVIVTHGTGNFQIQTTISSSVQVQDAPLQSRSAILTGTPFNAVAGPAQGYALATFTDDNLALTANDFSATVVWGDGGPAEQESPATVVLVAPGQFAIRGTHAYLGAGVFGVKVILTSLQQSSQPGNPPTAFAAQVLTTTAVVRSSTVLNGTAASLADATVCADTGAVTLATFTDTNPSRLPTDYSVVINWGDGTVSAGVVSSNPTGGFLVTGSHTYHKSGNFRVATRITAPDGTSLGLSTNIAVQSDVPDTAIVPTCQPLDLATGTAATVTLGQFSGPEGTYTAAVDWGDGSPIDNSATVTEPTAGSFKISGSHGYAQAGAYSVTVLLTSDGSTTFGRTTATVTEATPQATGANLLVAAGMPLANLVVAQFTTPNLALTASSFNSVNIAWGDGTSGRGRVIGGAGRFDVVAEDPQTFAQPQQSFGNGQAAFAGGFYQPVVSIATTTGLQFTVQGSIQVATLVQGNTLPSAPLTYFNDTDPGANPQNAGSSNSGFAAQILVNNGPPTPGNIITTGGVIRGVTPGTSISSLRLGVNTIQTVVRDVSPHGGVPQIPEIIPDSQVTATYQTTVADLPLSVQDVGMVPTPTVLVNQAVVGMNLGSVLDPDLLSAPTDYFVRIYWGDGTNSPVTLSGQSPWGPYQITGNHTYTQAGTYTVVAEIRAEDNSLYAVTRTVMVQPQPQPWAVTVGQRRDDADNATLLPVGNAVVSVNTGGLRLSHTLDFDQSPGTSVGGNPALVYNSDTISPRPVVYATLQTDPNAGIPNLIRARLVWDNGTPSAWNEYWPTNYNPGDPYQLALQVASPVTATGVYGYTIQIEVDFPDGTVIQRQASGQAQVVVRTNSSFGAGWSLSEIPQLVVDANGALLVFGTGESRYFTRSLAGVYQAPPEEFGTLTKQCDGMFAYRTKDGTTYLFGPDGLLTQVTDRDGLQTFYTYTDGLLRAIGTPDGGVTTFAYDNHGILNQITEPGNRVVGITTAVAPDNIADLVQITEPGAGTGTVRTFTYAGGDHLLTNDDWNDILGTMTVTPTGGPTPGVLLHNDGPDRFFQQQPDGTFSSPPGDGGTLRRNQDGTFTYTDQNETSWNFDLQGTLESAYDIGGRKLQYAWNAGLGASYRYGGTGQLFVDRGQTDQGASVLTEIDSAAEQGLDGTLIPASDFGQATVTDPRGKKTTYTLDLQGRTQTRQTADQALWTYTWDSHGQLIESVDPKVHVTRYSYDYSSLGAGDLLEVRYADRGVQKYEYDPVYNQVKKSSDPRVATTTYQLNQFGDVTASTNALNETTSFTWDRGLLTSESDGRGNTTTFEYDTARRLQDTIDPYLNRTTYGYDAAGNLLTTQDARGNTTTTVYDARNRLVETIDPLRHSTAMVYNPWDELTFRADANSVVDQTFYDKPGWTTETLQAAGTADEQATSFSYDAAGNTRFVTDAMSRVTEYQYDDVNQLILQIDAGSTSDERRTTYHYDAAGNLDSTTTGIASSASYAHPSTTNYSYDAMNRRVTVTEAANDPSLTRTTTTTYDKMGGVIQVEDPTSTKTVTKRDILGREVQLIEAFGTDLQRTTAQQGYDKAGNLAWTTNAAGVTTSFNYDKRNQLIVRTDAVGKTPEQRSVTYIYDQVGNLKYYIDGRGDATSYAYDAANQRTGTTVGLKMTLDANQQLGFLTTDATATATVDYDAVGNVARTIDAAGTITSYTYDNRYRVVAVTEANNGDPVSERRTTTTVYDKVGNVTDTIQPDSNNPAGVVTHYSYDVLYRRTAMTEAVGVVGVQRTTTYAYDAADNLVDTIDPRGTQTHYVYDTLNRQHVVIEDYTPPGASTTGINRTTTTNYNQVDQVLSVELPNGSVTSYAYDTLGRKVGMIEAYSFIDRNGQPSTALQRKTSYAYDAVDNLTLVTQYNVDGVNAYTQRQYNALNQVTLISQSGLLNTTYSYDKAGNVQSETEGGSNTTSGNTTSYAYDEQNRVTLRIDAYSPTPSTIAFSTATKYNKVGDVIMITDNAGTQTTFLYDRLHRLIEKTEAANRDTFQGMVQRRTTTYGYDARDNLVSVIDPRGTWTLTDYDALNRATIVYQAVNDFASSRILKRQYDADNNLISSTDGNQVKTTYDYDALNERIDMVEAVWQVNPDTQTSLERRTYYVYDTAGRLLSTTLKWANPRAGSPGEVLLQSTTTSYAYNALDQQTQVVEAYQTPDMRVTNYKYDRLGNVIQVRQKVDPKSAYQQVTTTKYDGLGRKLSVVNFDETNYKRVTTFHYDAAGNLDWEILPTGAITSNAYDALNRLQDTYQAWNTDDQQYTHYEYDAGGNVSLIKSQQRGKNQTTGPDYTTSSLTYDFLHRLIARTEAVGVAGQQRTTRYVYDQNGNLIAQITPIDYDLDAQGQPITNPKTDVTSFTYDGRNRRTTMVEAANAVANDPNDPARARTTTYTYDANDNLIRVEAPSATNPDATVQQRITTYTYDALNRQIGILDPRQIWTRTLYDGNNNVLQVSITPTGPNATTVTTGYWYDKLNRQTWVRAPDGGWTKNDYDLLDRLVETRTATAGLLAGLRTRYEYTLDGQIEHQADDVYSNEDSRWFRSAWLEYEYDSNARQLQSITDIDNVKTTYTYDKLGRRTSITDASGRKLVYEYDRLNHLVKITDTPGDPTATAVVEEIQYDSLGRKISDAWRKGQSIQTPLGYQYDARDLLVKASGRLRPISYKYDRLGQLWTSTDAIGTLTYAYDNAGRPIMIEDPFGGATTSAYDAGDRLVSRTLLTEGNTTVLRVDFQSYTVRNQVSVAAYYSQSGALLLDGQPDVVVKYFYDAVGRMRNVYQYFRNGEQSIPDAYTHATYADFDVAGRAITTYDSLDGSDSLPTLSYDPANVSDTATSKLKYTSTGRLEGDGTFTYRYDSFGNLTSNWKKSNSNIASWYGYDPAGNVTSVSRLFSEYNIDGIATAGLSYDSLGRLAGFSLKFQRNVIYSNHAGMPSSQVLYSNNPAEYYSYQGASIWCDAGLKPGGGALTFQLDTRYLTGDDGSQPWGAVDAKTGRIKWYIADLNGRISVVNDKGIVKARYTPNGVVGNDDWADRWQNQGRQTLLLGKETKNYPALEYANGQVTDTQSGQTLHPAASILLTGESQPNRNRGQAPTQTNAGSWFGRLYMGSQALATWAVTGFNLFQPVAAWNGGINYAAQGTMAGQGEMLVRNFTGGALDTLTLGASSNSNALNLVDPTSAAYGYGRFAGGVGAAVAIGAATGGVGGFVVGGAVGGFAYGGTGTPGQFNFQGGLAGAVSGAALAGGIGLAFAGGTAAMLASGALTGAGSAGVSVAGGSNFNWGDWGRATAVGGVSGLASAGFGMAGGLFTPSVMGGQMVGGILGGAGGAAAGQATNMLFDGTASWNAGEMVAGGIGGAIGGLLGWGFTRNFQHQSGDYAGQLLCNLNPNQEFAFLQASIAGGVLGGVAGDVLNQGASNFDRYGWAMDRWDFDLGSLMQAGLMGGITAAGAAKAQWAHNRACFCAGTPLRTPGGSKAIEQIRRGEWVLSRDESNPGGPVRAQLVEEVFVRTGRVWNLGLPGRTIRTTGEHPFFAQGKGWKPLCELAAGDRLLGEGGDWLTIEALEDTGSYETVYNLRVSEFHTYFVGCQEWGWSVWAHNSDYDTWLEELQKEYRSKTGNPDLIIQDSPQLRLFYQQAMNDPTYNGFQFRSDVASLLPPTTGAVPGSLVGMPWKLLLDNRNASLKAIARNARLQELEVLRQSSPQLDPTTPDAYRRALLKILLYEPGQKGNPRDFNGTLILGQPQFHKIGEAPETVNHGPSIADRAARILIGEYGQELGGHPSVLLLGRGLDEVIRLMGVRDFPSVEGGIVKPDIAVVLAEQGAGALLYEYRSTTQTTLGLGEKLTTALETVRGISPGVEQLLHPQPILEPLTTIADLARYLNLH
jgi:YD repeat-containing protein